MKKVTVDLKPQEEMVGVLEKMLEHRRAHPKARADELYYELLVTYHTRLKSAKEHGKKLIGHTIVVPTELIFAMDMWPMHLEGSSMTLAPVLGNFEEIFSTAKAFGMAPEICSAHRCLAALFLKGWAPPVDAVIWSNQVCDNTSKSGDLLMELYDVPGMFLDRPYRLNDKEVGYFTDELETMVELLERVGGHKLDPERLRETMEVSRYTLELCKEVYELRKAVPTPALNRRSIQIMFINWLFMGDPVAIPFIEAVRDECKEMVDKGVGAVPQENYRIISLFLPPLRDMRLLDWMHKEHGASIVADPYGSHWGDFTWDLSQPLLTLSHKSFASPICRQMHGPVEEGVVEDSVNDAINHKAEGAIYWAHIGCRQGCATIKVVKDALSERVGIPTLVMDIDILDPTFVSEEELKDKLEGFFEILEDRR